MSTSISSQPLASLVIHGKGLAVLLKSAKTKKESTSGNDPLHQSIHEDVKAIIVKLIDEIIKAQGQAFLPKESVEKFLERVKVTLEDFSRLDPDRESEYKNLTDWVNGFSLPTQIPADASLSLAGNSSEYKGSPLHCSQEEFSVTFGNLKLQEKTCLFCLSLLPATKESITIKKRELIHWWIGMDLIENQLEGDDRLAKLVSLGFIERAFGNKKFSNRYKINGSVCDLVKQEMSAFGKIEVEHSWSVLRSINNQQQQLQSPKNNTVHGLERRMSFVRSHTSKLNQDENFLPEALLNNHVDTLNAKAFEWVSKIKNVKVLHLGSWRHDPAKYIMVEDIELFRDLKHLGQVRFLSLQGISGITKLPEIIYKLGNLKVLDLRACHNLEALPEGIHSLKKLIHLDLSECYLLRQLPAGIKFLSELRVLKGFVTSPDLNSATTDLQGAKANKKLEISSSCEFNDLSQLSNLIKLTVRTRRMDFPTKQDLDTLCQMQQLKNLKIAWVGSFSDVETDSSLRRFPTKLKKLELQAAPESTGSLLLGLIGKQRANKLEKLYIRGGGLREVDSEKHCFHFVKVVNLRHLPKLHCDWDEFRKAFPNVIQLAIFRCPNLIFFPCDKNGQWQDDMYA